MMKRFFQQKEAHNITKGEEKIFVRKIKNDSKNEKQAVSLVAVVVIGAVLAWLLSRDQVTNSLSAASDYDVTITENFIPPEDWTPGQKIRKNVKAVNTGDIDSLVKFKFGHSFTVTGKGTAIKVSQADSADLSAKKAVEIDKSTAKCLQAGGYIIYKKDVIVTEVSEINSDTDLFADDGLYLLRREVKKIVDENNKLKTVTYENDGY